MTVKYRTAKAQRHYAGRRFELITIEDLDQAIEDLCETLGPHPDPFAEDLCPYFGILWPAAEGLAQYLEKYPQTVENKTVIELGCGLALPSMVASHLKARVIATDFHPLVKDFLEQNLKNNELNLTYSRHNWRETAVQEKYDVVIGSDILYESRHPLEVARGLKAHLKDGGEIILADPGRGHLQKFVTDMEELGFRYELAPQKVREFEIYVLRFISNQS